MEKGFVAKKWRQITSNLFLPVAVPVSSGTFILDGVLVQFLVWIVLVVAARHVAVALGTSNLLEIMFPRLIFSFIWVVLVVGADYPSSVKMQNAAGQYVDLYVPRKCSWTNRLIHSSDYASVSLNIAKVDAASGQRLPENDTFCLSGYIRSKVCFYTPCGCVEEVSAIH